MPIPCNTVNVAASVLWIQSATISRNGIYVNAAYPSDNATSIVVSAVNRKTLRIDAAKVPAAKTAIDAVIAALASLSGNTGTFCNVTITAPDPLSKWSLVATYIGEDKKFVRYENKDLLPAIEGQPALGAAYTQIINVIASAV